MRSTFFSNRGFPRPRLACAIFYYFEVSDCREHLAAPVTEPVPGYCFDERELVVRASGGTAARLVT